MRITNSMVVRQSLRDLNQSLARLQASEADLSTGRVVRKASDDPARATAAMATRTQLRRADQRARSLSDAQGWLSSADSVLMSTLDTMTRVEQLATQGGNLGVSSPESRQAIAAELGAIRAELLAVANTTYLDRPIFNGTAAGPAYDAATGAYLGNDAAVVRDVGPGTTIVANLTGEHVFGSQSAPEGDLFAVLDRLSSAIAAGDAGAIATEQANLDVAARRLSSAAAEIGTRAARIDSVKARAASDDANLRTLLSEIEDTDIAEALITVSAHENAYTAALTAASRVIPPSLVDYLR